MNTRDTNNIGYKTQNKEKQNKNTIQSEKSLVGNRGKKESTQEEKHSVLFEIKLFRIGQPDGEDDQNVCSGDLNLRGV